MRRTLRIHGMMLVVVLCVAALPAFAGSAIVGSVAGTMNATVGGQPLAPNAVVFSGDSLKVKDGAAVVALSNSGRLVFGEETEASLLREGNGVTVVLDRGHMSLYQGEGGSPLQVKVGTLSVLPAKGYKTLGEVAMMGDGIVVTAKTGALRVVGNGAPVEVGQGKSVFIKNRTARSPQAGTMQKLSGGGSTALEAGALGAGVVAAILAGIGLSRSGDAKDNAAAALSAANTASSNAAAADSDALAAIAAASNAANLANLSGCALNNFNDVVIGGPDAGSPSPYVPPAGYTCPTGPTAPSL